MVSRPDAPTGPGRDEWIGYASLFAGVALFSTIEVVSKLIGLAVDPLLLTFFRFLVTGIVLVGAAWPQLSLRSEPLARRDFGVFLLNGAVGVCLAIPLFHWAVLTLDKAASAAVVFSANPVFVLLLGRFINGERWTPRALGGAALGVAGISLFALETGELRMESIAGLGLMLSAALFFALSTCLAKRFVRRYGAMLLMGGSALAGCALLSPIVVWRLSVVGFDGIVSSWVGLVYIATAGTAAAYFLYYFGLVNTSVQSGSMMFFLKPVLASLLAAVVLHETINRYMVGGTGLILAGLVLAIVRPPTRSAGR